MTDTPKKSIAETTAENWIKPGGGYDSWKKDDPAREKVLPPGGTPPEGYTPGATSMPKPIRQPDTSRVPSAPLTK